MGTERCIQVLVTTDCNNEEFERIKERIKKLEKNKSVIGLLIDEV